MPHWCCRAANPPSSLGCKGSSDAHISVIPGTTVELSVRSKASGWAGQAELFLSHHISLQFMFPLIPLFYFPPTFFFFPSAKAYSPEFYYDTPNPTLSQKQSKNYSYILQWTQKDPDAVDPILKYRLEVRQVRSALLEPSARALGKRTSQEEVTSMSSCWLRAEGDEIVRSWWSCTFPTEWKRETKCTAQHSFLCLVLGSLALLLPIDWTVHAQCLKWGLNASKTPQSSVGIVDFIGQSLQQVEFHPSHSYELKGNKLKGSPGRNCREKSSAVSVAEALSYCHSSEAIWTI